ncbi:AMP-binding protein [Actinoplanes sp. NPDC004185]
MTTGRDREPAASGVVAGAPLAVLGDLVGGPHVGDLLRRAAERAPEQLALCTATDRLTFAELDAQADRCASTIRQAVAGPATPVALAAELAPWFAVAFFAVSRSGNVPVLVNPLLREEGLGHVLRTSRAVAAILPPAVRLRLDRGGLPDLRHVLAPADLLAPPVTGDPGPVGADPADIACIQFTSGSTGPPKAVLLTHRNLTVNAAQSAFTHRVSATSVMFNNLPTFHLMHLTVGLAAGATHVLWPDEAVGPALQAARRHHATHFYSLPVRLSRIAGSRDRGAARLPALRLFLSGGSTLPQSTRLALAEQFGVPVLQGYGLQETSPSTHFDDLDRPKAGSSGPPVPGTECRIVHVDTRAVLGPGAKGEIQVRGPQLMKGYLGRNPLEGVDEQGWFSTGDVGYQDDDGYLFVVDRIKDVFKCDNWLVSPTQIERVLLRHPDVEDCVVFDYPDEIRGAVAAALVVPARADADVAAIDRYLADQLPYYEHLHVIDVVERIPRLPNGKVQRRHLREQAVARHAGHPSERSERQETTVHTFINRFTVNGDTEEFESLLGTITNYMVEQPGFRSHRLYRSGVDPKVYVETAEWDDADAQRKAIGGEGFQGPVKQVMKIANAEPGPFTLVSEHAK